MTWRDKAIVIALEDLLRNHFDDDDDLENVIDDEPITVGDCRTWLLRQQSRINDILEDA